MEQNKAAIEQRKTSVLTNNYAVKERLELLSDDDLRRHSDFPTRINIQKKKIDLPLLPTTTIGSFPQTQTIRQSRRQYKANLINDEQYTQAMQQEIAENIKKQEAIGIDVLVHGEPERNDMVEYFGEQLEGFLASAHGWVQSYGSRCVKTANYLWRCEKT